MESFLLPRVNPEDVNAMGVRLRVYMWGGRMRRERLLGEARVSFDQINLQLETTMVLPLQPPPSSVRIPFPLFRKFNERAIQLIRPIWFKTIAS